MIGFLAIIAIIFFLLLPTIKVRSVAAEALPEEDGALGQIKTFIEGKIVEIKTALEDDVSGKFGERDKQYEEMLEEKMGELQDQIKILMEAHDNNPPGAFGEDGDPWVGFKNGDEFIRSVILDGQNKTHDPRLDEIIKYENEKLKEKAAGDGVEVSTSEFGGYLAPEAFRTQIWEKAIEVSDLINRIMIIPIGAQGLRIPALGGYDQSGGTVFGGIQFKKENENDTMADTRPKFEMIEFHMDLHAALVPISDSMMRFSAVSIEPICRQLLGTALGWYIDSKLVGGTGAGEPRGIINSACKIPQDAETNQTAATITRENLIKMYSRVYNKSNMMWGFNPECGPQLDSLAFIVGAGGAPVTMEQAFKNKPYMESDHFSALGTAGDIAAFQPDQIVMVVPPGQASAARIDSSLHFRYDVGQNTLRCMHYMDAHVAWRTFHTPVNGSATRGPVVTLATRS
jgi:HK97 family phage major capsid protein